ncbi:M3 family oligoendopeptidase [Paenibacillus dendritiformis]|uniref:Oligoendopeptidase F n=1 Tax=Paenibacillus dendritiformis C454 TaxID=1131935 RepID=H3SCH1_9BACL|nr:M3 family oligoendopeptidase [Paenibacillus dendritiformis]EHQ63245.1 oligoendopeptidase F [Paenibacillus dendritiformis C454]CAH8769111.1 M3 family oligoendopeptidase [Paenibacillus dendritiformis]
MQHPLNPTWDLESIFPGGSDSEALQQSFAAIEQDLALLKGELKEMSSPLSKDSIPALAKLTTRLQDLNRRMQEAGAFISCLTAQNLQDKKAVQLTGRKSALSAQLVAIDALYDELLRGMPDELWSRFLALPEIEGVGFNLNERRETAKEKLGPALEALAGDLAVDGYHGWAEMYNTIVSHVRINYEENGVNQQLSAGQAHNKLSHPDRRVREEMFKLWEQEWSDKADFCADALNHIAGFRLKLYERRGWDDVLKEPLARNRMSQATLGAMWDTIVRNKPKFVQYLERKAKLLGVEKLSWCDVDAPIGGSQTTISYDDGADAIVEQFRKFSPRMADFAVRAFENRWIEAEDRPGKRPGGFCTSLPVSNQTRIFMTYAGTPSNVSTLAHELGHGYHQHVMEGLPAFAQRYAMNVAETASTFAEMIVADSAVKGAKDEQEKLGLLEDKIQRSIAFYMNIHARFLFETRFYEKRKAGLVSSEQICALMEEAQQEAYCGALGSLHPHFWASKMHFYFTHVPFYNFPYTFGYLFSTGLYARALEEGESFAAKYDALLRDTAVMTVEDLASKHLGVDLTKPDFWQSAINVTLKDVELFLQMTE